LPEKSHLLSRTLAGYPPEGSLGLAWISCGCSEAFICLMALRGPGSIECHRYGFRAKLEGPQLRDTYD
jgi:hypothetical protein